MVPEQLQTKLHKDSKSIITCLHIYFYRLIRPISESTIFADEETFAKSAKVMFLDNSVPCNRTLIVLYDNFNHHIVTLDCNIQCIIIMAG